MISGSNSPSLKGEFDPLITMVPSELLQNVPFGRYKHFLLKITILPNTIKIEMRVPQAMDNPMPPTFGRIDALRGSSVQITKITDSTKRHENRVAGAPDHGRSNPAHFWSHRRVTREFSRNNCNDRFHQTPRNSLCGCPWAWTYRVHSRLVAQTHGC